MAKVEGYIEVGRREGELVIGGGRADGAGLERGHFFEPTIFAGVKPMDRIAQEEIFGPVLSVIPVPDYAGRRHGPQPDPLRPLLVDLHGRREHGLPGDA